MRTIRDAHPSLELFVAVSSFICMCKSYALYGSNDLWSERSIFYLGAVAAVASYLEILVVAGMCVAHGLGCRILRNNKALRFFLQGLIGLVLGFVVLVNLVNAELLGRLGAPLTLPLLQYSDVLGSVHGRNAIWSWIDPNLGLLALAGACVAVLLVVAMLLAKRKFGDPVLISLVSVGLSLVVFAGLTRSPAPANFSQSGSLAFLLSVPSGRANVPKEGARARPPFNLTGSTAGLPRPAGQIRNVILIVIEAAAAQYLDQYGGPYNVTPHLNARSSQLIVVPNAYAQGTSSTVALGTFLAARYPALAAQGQLSPGQTSLLPTLLSQAGVRTGLFHSSDTRFSGAGNFLAQSGLQTIRDYRHRRCVEELIEDIDSSLGNFDDCTFLDMTNWIERRPGTPFFAMAWTFQSHYPYFARSKRRFPIRPETVPRLRALQDMQRYLNSISDADRAIETLIRRLERIGRYDDTLIIVTSDHGQAFGQHGTYGNGAALYEESVRIPLLLINPRLKSDPSIARSVGQIDIAPTIADVLGLRTPTDWDGVSVFATSPERALYFTNVTADRALGYRLRERKVIANLVRGTLEIYDLSRDPGERIDLAEQLSPKERDRQMDWLAAWGSRTNDSTIGARRAR